MLRRSVFLLLFRYSIRSLGKNFFQEIERQASIDLGQGNEQSEEIAQKLMAEFGVGQLADIIELDCLHNPEFFVAQKLAFYFFFHH